MDNEFLLQDRLQKIRQIINQYGEENFYISFSGGKDSTVLSALIDIALPDNKIPRVYCDTGIELNMIHNFVIDQARTDIRFFIVKPSLNIRTTLNTFGYPFKSKQHSACVNSYQNNNDSLWAKKYVSGGYNWHTNTCPQKLIYQFSPEFNIKISDKCCKYLKEKPLNEWAKIHNKKYAILGLMLDEGGRRESAKCLAFRNKKLYSFNPLIAVDKNWENWFIDKYNINICNIYKPPYNFTRTGCKGCPFNPHLQRDLDTLEKFFPAERKQCEIIWKPVYDEYRRIGYRLKG